MYKKELKYIEKLLKVLINNIKSKMKLLQENKTVLNAFFYNLLILVLSLFFFEPTPKQDDYDQTMVLYGGFTGEYSHYAQYISFILSKIIRCLMCLFPFISWYYIILYFFIFLSLVLITYVFIARSENNEWKFPVFIVLLFCGYELFIRFTFTKVAGITMIAGFIFLLYLIEKYDTSFLKYLIGIFFIFLGMIVRSSMYELMVEIFFSVFVISILSLKRNKKNILFQVTIFILIVVSMYGCSKLLNIMDLRIKSQNEEWNYYNEVNSSRVALQDYGMPEYKKYSNEYANIGMSENDYNAWKNEGIYNDYEFFTPERLREIRNIESIQKNKSVFQIVLNSFRNMLSYYCFDTGFFLFFAAIIFLCFYISQNRMRYLIPVWSCCLFAYIYMYYRGRLRHHVDVMILIAGAIILIFYCFPIQDTSITNKIRCFSSLGILILIFVIIHYDKLVHSSYYGADYGSGKSQYEEYKKNRENLSLMSEDKNHLYLIGTFSTDYIFNREWPIFEVVTPGFYHNMIASNQYHVPHSDKILDDFNIKNLYKELTNNAYMYVVTVDEKPTFVDTLCTYISEHYYSDVFYTKVKEIDNINIYRFTSGDFKPLWKSKKKGNVDNVVSNVTLTKTEGGKYVIEGYAYIDGVDSYSQNIYLEVTDEITGDKEYVYTLQSENQLFLKEDKYHGRYSKFYGIVDKNEIANIQINIYLETENEVYCLKL